MSTPPTTISTSLERSFQDCSLNHRSTTTSGEETNSPLNLSVPELNSQPPNSLPSHWEQCLDLKTGEKYYVNLKTGVETKEFPRISSDQDNCYSDEYDSEEGSSSSREQWSGSNSKNNNDDDDDDVDVLVVGGCRSCLMYYMVPKQLRTCPKCRGQLIRFDRPQHASS